MSAAQLLFAAALTIGVAAPALAGEGTGDPFPGPNAVVREDVGHPNYTMGGDAPFNYFVTPRAAPMNDYPVRADTSPEAQTGPVLHASPSESVIVSGAQPHRHG